MNWFVLTLLCAFSLASADAATKAWLRDYSATELTLVRFTLSGLLLLPLLIGLPDLRTLPAAFWGWMGLSVPLEIAAMLLYMAAIRDHPLSLTLPYLAFTPAFVVLVAWLLLGERIGAAGSGGIILVVAGAWLLNSSAAQRSDWRSWLRPLTAIRSAPGARMMLAVAVLYAGTAVTGKAALAYLPAQQFGAFYFFVIGALLLLALPLTPGGARPPLRRLWRRPLAVLLVATLNAVMVLTHFLAIQRVEVAYMIAVKRTSLVFGILYGVLWFGERGLSTRLPAGLLMLAGVALILLG